MKDINYLAVIAAAVSAFLLGGFWYSPKLFGAIWGREAGFTNSHTEKGEVKHGPMVFILSFLLSLIAALAFAYYLGEDPYLSTAVKSGFLIGISLVATSFGINYLFAGRTVKLLLIDAGYHIVQFTLYGVILGLWH
jgi:hypothetical protein